MKNQSLGTRVLWLAMLTYLLSTLTACGMAGVQSNSRIGNNLPGSGDGQGNPINPTPGNGDGEEPAGPEEPAEVSYWKGALFTGDNSIVAFDNARKDLKTTFMKMDSNLQDPDLAELSMMNSEINGTVQKMSKAALKQALLDLNMGDKDRCLIHMTSHGSKSAFYLVSQGGMTPTEFDEILDETCGTRPTVLLISACYSGIFTDSSAMQQDNRIILSAARKDRTSFGCSAEAEYTYWDGCLLDNLESSTSWSNLYDNVTECITRKEGSGFTPSLPQKFIGSAVTNLPYLGQ